MIEKVEGIVIKEINYGESSKILTLFTKEYGIIGVIVKGCRSLKNPLCSLSNKLIYAHFQIYYKKDKLSIVKSIDLIDSFKEIRKDIFKISYVGFILELTEQVFKQNNNLEIYELVINSLFKINEGKDPLVITNILELKFLNYLGVMPIIDSCSICGSTKNIVSLSIMKGGYVCRECRGLEKILNYKTIKMLRMFYYVDIAKIATINIDEKIKNEINEFLKNYYDEYTGLYLKSRDFLNNLIKLS